MNKPQIIRFSEKLVLRVPEGFSERLDALARDNLMSRSELARQTLLSRLRDGERATP
jgi:hypothetical protein